SPSEWRAALHETDFTGKAELFHRCGTRISVQFAGHPELVTGRRLVLLVVVRTARSGRLLTEEAASERPEAAALTVREREITRLIALGLSGPEMAQELHLSHNTVRTHAR